MNIKEKIIATFVAFSVATVIGVYALPNAEPVQYVLPLMKFSLGVLVLITGLSVYLEDELEENEKNLLMNGFMLAILVPSFYAAGAFVHESQTSWTGGEVHWHADFEVLMASGNGTVEELDLVNPGTFCEVTAHESSYMCKLNDRTGSTEYHEHNDDRIHVEGVFKEREDATLSAFFKQFYGTLENGRMEFPARSGYYNVTDTRENFLKILVNKGTAANRQWCGVGNNIPREDICESFGRLADSPSDYVISPHTQGPTLDKIFIIYDSKTPEEALEDVREDDLYRGHGLTKEGEGYDG